MHPIAFHIILTLLISSWHYEPLRPTSKRDGRSNIRTRFLCASRQRFTIVLTRAQRARGAAQAQPPQANMDQGQPAPPAQPQGQAAPPAQPGAAAPPPVLPAPPLPPPPAVPAAPPPPAFALGPGRYTPSSTSTIPLLAALLPSCTTKPLRHSKQSSMERPITWPSSWLACEIEHADSIGTG